MLNILAAIIWICGMVLDLLKNQLKEHLQGLQVVQHLNHLKERTSQITA